MLRGKTEAQQAAPLQYRPEYARLTSFDVSLLQHRSAVDRSKANA
jgi:hypothetical protein